MGDVRRFTLNWDYYYFGVWPIHISWVSLDITNISFTTPWETVQLTATATPWDAVETPSFSWSSSDTSIATVDSNGLVTCVTPWECIITVTVAPWGFTATCEVSPVIEYDVDFLLVWGWGAGGRWYWSGAWWGWAWGVMYCLWETVCSWNYNIVIWDWGIWRADKCIWEEVSWCNSQFGNWVAYWGWGWGGKQTSYLGCYWWDWWSWGGGSASCAWLIHWGCWCLWQGNSGGNWYISLSWAWGWWGWYWWAWCNGICCSLSMNSYWWDWWDWLTSSISWQSVIYAAWWGWGGKCWGGNSTWGGCGRWGGNDNWYDAICYWSWWGGGYTLCSSYCCKWWDWYQWIFILRYPSSCGYNISWGCKYECSGYCIHCFTEDGTLCFK